MSEKEIKDLFDAIDNRLILYQATNQIPNIDFDRLVKLSVAYEELQQENQQLKEQKNKALGYIKNYNSMGLRYQDMEAKDKLNVVKNILNNRLDYENTEVKDLKQQLKQRDEVIDEAIIFIESHSSKEPPYYEFLEFYNKSNLSELLEILQKCEGEENE